MNHVDLALFQYDYDLTRMSFFVSADDHVYSRYGGRDAFDPEGRLSVAGLKHTMREVLRLHQAWAAPAQEPVHKPLFPSDLFQVKGKGCMHCHHIWEGLRRQAKMEKRFDPESLYVYPLPENIGLKLDIDVGNRVVKVLPDSPAFKAGVHAGDLVEYIARERILSQGDVMWALHQAPVEGEVTLAIRRGGVRNVITLVLPRGWKHTDLTWRGSMRRNKTK